MIASTPPWGRLTLWMTFLECVQLVVIAFVRTAFAMVSHARYHCHVTCVYWPFGFFLRSSSCLIFPIKVRRLRSFSLLWMLMNVINDFGKEPISISHFDVSSIMLHAEIAASSCLCQLLMKVSVGSPSRMSMLIRVRYEKILVVPSEGWCNCWRWSHIARADPRLRTWSTCRSLRCIIISILASRSLLFQSLNSGSVHGMTSEPFAIPKLRFVLSRINSILVLHIL